MKTTIALAFTGLLLFAFAMGASYTSGCFHCGPTLSHSLESITLSLFSLPFLIFALIRTFKALKLFQPNSYNIESLVPYDESKFFVGLPYEPIFIVLPALKFPFESSIDFNLN